MECEGGVDRVTQMMVLVRDDEHDNICVNTICVRDSIQVCRTTMGIAIRADDGTCDNDVNAVVYIDRRRKSGACIRSRSRVWGGARPFQRRTFLLDRINYNLVDGPRPSYAQLDGTEPEFGIRRARKAEYCRGNRRGWLS